jgi:hypothetical protein
MVDHIKVRSEEYLDAHSYFQNELDKLTLSI